MNEPTWSLVRRPMQTPIWKRKGSGDYRIRGKEKEKEVEITLPGVHKKAIEATRYRHYA